MQSNTANFYKDDGNDLNGYDDGYAVTGLTSYDSNQNYLTDVGAYTLSSSFYETFDQGGNVFEWNEADIFGHVSSRGLRGGSWSNNFYTLHASDRSNGNPSYENYAVGFRVASVPEPGSVTLLVCGLLTGFIWWRRKG